MATLKVTQLRSLASRTQKQRGTIRALGLRRIGDSATHRDTPEIRGMIRAVSHLIRVDVEEGEDE